MWQLYLVYPFIMFYNFIFFPFSKVEIKFFEPDLIQGMSLIYSLCPQ